VVPAEVVLAGAVATAVASVLAGKVSACVTIDLCPILTRLNLLPN